MSKVYLCSTFKTKVLYNKTQKGFPPSHHHHRTLTQQRTVLNPWFNSLSAAEWQLIKMRFKPGFKTVTDGACLMSLRTPLRSIDAATAKDIRGDVQDLS